jgi:Ca2+-binding EF-hand superfamily protein
MIKPRPVRNLKPQSEIHRFLRTGSSSKDKKTDLKGKMNTTMRKLIFLIASFAIVATAMGQNERPNRERPDFFALADKNEDGSVSLKELVDARIAMMQRRAGGQQREGGPDPEQMRKRIETSMKEAFKKADSDENGALSKEEFSAMPQRGGPGGRGGRGGPEGGRGGPGGERGGPRGGGNA